MAPGTLIEDPPILAADEDTPVGVALVTGGSRGIGAAICRSLASQGGIVAAGYSSNREPPSSCSRSSSAAARGPASTTATWATPMTACASSER